MVSTLSNVLATIGTVCWCIQLIPQCIHNYKVKNTEGFPELMALLWCLCAPFFAVFMISTDASIPLMIQPHLFGFFCTVVYIQIMYYPPVQRPIKQIVLRAGGFILFQVVLEVASIIPLRNLYINHDVKWPPLIYGIIATIVLAIGLIPPYFELWSRNGRVIGINFLFLLLDLSGAVFSLASVAVEKGNIDIMSLVLYIVCAALETGIFASHFVWLIRFKLFKRMFISDEESQTSDGIDENDKNEVVEVTNNLDYEITNFEEKPEFADSENYIDAHTKNKKDAYDDNYDLEDNDDLTTSKTLT